MEQHNIEGTTEKVHKFGKIKLDRYLLILYF